MCDNHQPSILSTAASGVQVTKVLARTFVPPYLKCKDTATHLHLSRNLLSSKQQEGALCLTHTKALFPADFVPHHVAMEESAGLTCFTVMSTAHQKQQHPSSLGNDQVLGSHCCYHQLTLIFRFSFLVKDQSILPSCVHQQA